MTFLVPKKLESFVRSANSNSEIFPLLVKIELHLLHCVFSNTESSIRFLAINCLSKLYKILPEELFLTPLTEHLESFLRCIQSPQNTEDFLFSNVFTILIDASFAPIWFPNHIASIILSLNNFTILDSQIASPPEYLHSTTRINHVHDLLKSLFSILTKCSAYAIDETLYADALKIVACFCSNMLVSRDSRSLSALLLVVLLRREAHVREWVSLFLVKSPTFLFVDSGLRSKHSPVYEDTFEFLRRTEWWNAKMLFSLLSIIKAILLEGHDSLNCSLVMTNQLQKKNSTFEVSIANLLFMTVSDICDGTSDPDVRTMAFDVLAVWLRAIRKILEVDPENLQNNKSKINISPELLEKGFAYVLDGWEDPADTMQHK
ncbi:hypothetical protein HK096_008954, partial [Nowakowskiella sp. JEL0078]